MATNHRAARGLCLAALLAGSVALHSVMAAAATPQDAPPSPVQLRGFMPVPVPSAPKADPMAEYLRTGKRPPALQGPSPVAQAAIQAAAPAAVPHRTHLHCVFKIKPDGSYKLLRAVEVEGDPLISDESAGPLISEVSKGNEVVAVQGMADPFEERSFPGPAAKGLARHHLQTADEAEVVVKIPSTGLADADLDGLSLRFYKWQGTEALEKVDRESLKEYKWKSRVRSFAEIPSHFLGEEIRSKGMRAPR